MTKQSIEELEFETTSCFVAFDAESGEVLYVHECMKQKGRYEAEADPDEEIVLKLARADYDDRKLKVMKLPDGFELKEDMRYSVDTYSGELKESEANTMRFRDFNKLKEE